MRLSDNERLVLQTIADDSYATASQIAVACGLSYNLTRFCLRNLFLAGLMDVGYVPSYAGWKVLDGEDPKSSDFRDSSNVRISDVKPLPPH